MNSISSLLVLTLVACLHVGDAYKILAVFPLPGKSHTILGDGIVRHLANAGHEVTYITPIIKKSGWPSNVRQIDVSDNFNYLPKEMLEIKAVMDRTYTMDIRDVFSMMLNLHNTTYHNPNVEALLMDTSQNFDVVLVEWMFNEVYSGLIRGTEIEVYNSLAPFFKARGQKMPVYQELKYNASLMLGNSHVSLGQPVTLPANYKNIGGYHIETKVAPLPEDLQKLLDNAKHGLIYFSMGSNLKSKDMPDELKVSLLKMFGTLKQTVLWKFEEVLPNLPGNVHIVSWAPQQSILSHPNCLLFITHGGLLSTTETVHFGKPIIGIPVFADQFVNVNRAVKKGIAIKVDLSYFMADELKAAIEEVIQNPSYSKKVKELSFVYHHRPTPPGVELVHWVEHVVKTGGAPHLRSPALHVPFYQKLYLDLAAVILAVIFLIRAAFRRLFKKNLKKIKKN